MVKVNLKGGSKLKKDVIDQGLCTLCGACLNLCPYLVKHNDNVILLHECNLTEGWCYQVCPRTQVKLEEIKKSLFKQKDLIPELGSVKGFFMCRASNELVRRRAQHGGTVSALMAMAIQERIIDSCILTERNKHNSFHSITITNPEEVIKHGGSKFVVSSTIAKFNKVSKLKPGKMGLVVTPCEGLALAKMRITPHNKNDNPVGKLGLVIGLFCGWSFSWEKLKERLSEKGINVESIVGMDIPPSRYRSIEIYTDDGKRVLPLGDVTSCISDACRYCFDLTGEFSDISVGSARCPEGWGIARSWNQIIVRTPLGQEIIECAKLKGVLEFRDMPEDNFENLKIASMNKKRRAIRNLMEKSDRLEDIDYYDLVRGLV